MKAKELKIGQMFKVADSDTDILMRISEQSLNGPDLPKPPEGTIGVALLTPRGAELYAIPEEEEVTPVESPDLSNMNLVKISKEELEKILEEDHNKDT